MLPRRPWPRRYTVDGTQLALYRPQLESWAGDKLVARAVLGVKTGIEKDKDGKDIDVNTYGVLWLSARIETDKDARELVLTNIKDEKANFSAAKPREADYFALARKVSPATDLVVSLDQAEAALAMLGVAAAQPSAPVHNTPPDIIFSHQPASLVLVNGSPVWKPSGVNDVVRLVNTRAMMLMHGGKYYLGYGGHWVSATAIDGPWTTATSVPSPVDQVMQKSHRRQPGPGEEGFAGKHRRAVQ